MMSSSLTHRALLTAHGCLSFCKFAVLSPGIFEATLSLIGNLASKIAPNSQSRRQKQRTGRKSRSGALLISSAWTEDRKRTHHCQRGSFLPRAVMPYFKWCAFPYSVWWRSSRLLHPEYHRSCSPGSRFSKPASRHQRTCSYSSNRDSYKRVQSCRLFLWFCLSSFSSSY